MSAAQVRVRFAPSPTGYLHIGGARTALFNWLLARREGGVFVLRIEDTDQSRHVHDSLPKILDDLRWLGLNWDEGPQVEGPCGPYFQSQRLGTYEQYCRQLLDRGQAYYTFDTADELAAMRTAARERKETFRYPRPAVLPGEAEAGRRRDQGQPVTVRFKMPDHDITVHDEVLGDVRLRRDELEDFVILKADGFPTYHFACVVDDAAMNITHVIRGSEHLSNTPKHIALQQALGFAPPAYAHVPIILNIAGSKMSKRDKERALAKDEVPPEIEVHDFRQAGYLPEALLNFIALLGWSPGDDREFMDLAELTECFDLSRIGKTSARFDREKLLAFNTHWAARLPAARLRGGLRDLLALRASPMDRADDETLDRVLAACAGFRTFSDVIAKAGFLFESDGAIEYQPTAVEKVLVRDDGAGYHVLTRLLEALQHLPQWNAETLEALLQAKTEDWGVGFGKVAQPLRVALSGTTVSPQIIDTLLLMGRERTLNRIQHTLDRRVERP